MWAAMSKRAHTLLVANGQRLSVESTPAVLANAVVGRLCFDVSLSSHWDGFESYYVLLRRSGGDVCACSIEDGTAVADSAAIAGAGTVEVAVMACGGGRRLTSTRAILHLRESGL